MAEETRNFEESLWEAIERMNDVVSPIACHDKLIAKYSDMTILEFFADGFPMELVETFITYAAGRSESTRRTVENVLGSVSKKVVNLPDVIVKKRRLL